MANKKLIKELKKDVKAFKIEQEFYQAVIDALADAHKLEKKLKKADAKAEKHLKNCKKRDEKLQEAEDKNATLNNDIGTLQEMLKQDREAFDKELSKLKATKTKGKGKKASQLATALDAANAKVAELETANAEANDRIDNLGTAIASANDRIAELQGSMTQDFEAYNIELEELNKKLAAEADTDTYAVTEEPTPDPEPSTEPAPTPKTKKEQALDRIRQKAKDIDFDRIGRANESDKDDLKRIKGVGPYIESKLNALGIYTFQQVANFTADDEDKINKTIEFFPGRVKRDQWPRQAAELMATNVSGSDLESSNEEEE